MDDLVDALCEAFKDEKERRTAVWFDGTPVFTKEQRGMCNQHGSIKA